MRWLNKSLCTCLMVLSVASCAQEKKLPIGERISILDNASDEILAGTQQIKNIPSARIVSEWNQNGVNSNHIVGNIKANFNLKAVWTESFGKGINKRDLLLAAPVVGGKNIYVMDTKGKVSAYNLQNGDKLWENILTANIGGFKETKSRASGLAYEGNKIYATTGFGGVYAMNATTGEPLWRKIMESPIRIAPTVTNKMLLVQTVDNRLFALDKNTGQEIWRFGVAHEDTVIAGGASPAYDAEENIVVAGFSNGEIVVLNATLGTPLWSQMLVSNKQARSTTEINTIGSYPIVEEGVIYATSNSDMMVALDMRTGDKLWEKEIGAMQNMLLAGDYIFVISNRNVLYAIEKYSGDAVWSLDIREYLNEEESKAAVYASSPLMLNGQILLAFSNGKILKVDSKNGQVVAKTELERDISNGLISAQQKVLAISDDADIIVFE